MGPRHSAGPMAEGQAGDRAWDLMIMGRSETSRDTQPPSSPPPRFGCAKISVPFGSGRRGGA